MKTEDIYADILAQLSQGVWKVGEQIPTERVLAERYGVSRPTISRVLNRLRDAGQLKRVVGAGSFLTAPEKGRDHARATIGLFVPGLGRGEIFEPICARIAELSQEYEITLVWGSIPGSGNEDRGERLLRAARYFVAQGLDGVFFQPVERETGAEAKNLRIASVFDQAGVPLVLLDCDYLPYPERSGHDLVGIDNIAAACRLCGHLLGQGARRVDFVWPPDTAGTRNLRLIGYREALRRAGLVPEGRFEHEGDPRNPDFAEELLRSGATDLICVNDETAALLMGTFGELGLSVPGDLRIAGFDDVKYARLARVPLTTMRQPCRDLGELALRTMIDRIEHPDRPTRTITTDARLCERESTRKPGENRSRGEDK